MAEERGALQALEGGHPWRLALSSQAEARGGDGPALGRPSDRSVTVWVSRPPCGSAGKECACNSGDLGSIPGLGRSPGEGKGDPLQYSSLENSVD